MNERILHETIRLKLNPYRSPNTGFIESFSVEIYFDGTTIGDDDRVIAVELAVPESLWQIPVVGVEVKSKLTQMLKEIVADE